MEKDKNNLVALLLAVFLGGLGIHKFYQGKTMQGILYLLFCWTFIPVVLSFFDGVVIVFKLLTKK